MQSITRSARQRRFGDIDGYFGLDLEISAEVKDEAVTSANVASEFGAFLRDASNHRIRGLAVVRSIDEAARAVLKARDVTALTAGEMAAIVEAWDWRKQDAALHGLLHFLAHVEQDPRAVKRLLCFIRARDEGHDALAYFVANTSE